MLMFGLEGSGGSLEAGAGVGGGDGGGRGGGAEEEGEEGEDKGGLNPVLRMLS